MKQIFGTGKGYGLLLWLVFKIFLKRILWKVQHLKSI